MEIAPSLEHRDSAAKPRMAHRRLLVLMGALTAIGPFSFDTYLPALPQLTADLGVTPSAAQLTLSGYMLGLALGQLGMGPISDARGRRGPLLVSLAVFVVAALVCATAPSIQVLVVARFVQGLAGAGGLVASRAVIRDVFAGPEAAKAFSQLMVMLGVAPVVAPLVGSVLLRFGNWRLIFVFMALLAAALLILNLRFLRETLPPERRAVHGPREVWSAWRLVSSERLFRRSTLIAVLLNGWLIVFLSGSSFALQEGFGISAQAYGLLFAIMVAGIAVAGRVNHRLLDRMGMVGMLRVGLVAGLVSGAAMLGSAISGRPLLIVVAAALFISNSTFGIIMPNAMALGTLHHAERAATAAGLTGLLQSLTSALLAPVVGLVAGTSLTAFCATFAGMILLSGTVGLTALRGVKV